MRERLVLQAILFLLPSLAVASGCATTSITAFRDPAYPNAQFGRIAAFAVGMDIEAAVDLERQVCARLAPTTCVPGKSILPPTRVYPADEVAERIAASNVEAVLIVSLVSDDAETRYVGTVTKSTASATTSSAGTVNLYGNNAYWSGSTVASSASTTVSTPVFSHTRLARAVLGMFDSKTGDIVWAGQIRTSGNGILSVGTGEFVRSSTTKIAADLRAAGLVRADRSPVLAHNKTPKFSDPPNDNQIPALGHVVTRETLTPLHASPNEDSKVLFRVRKGAILPVLSEAQDWLRVRVGTTEAYVSASAVRTN